MDEILLQDPELAQAIILESQRQVTKLELIASENFVSPAVREAQGSVMTHKYAEGYPGKRYYGGCEYVDIAENLAIERAKKIFGCEYANVQPHSGSQANMGAYFSFLKPGDTILGMDLSHGGHLTHGSPVNFSGKLFNNVFYGVNRETGCIDYDEVARIAREHKPAAIVAGASAYPRKIDFARFRAIADEVGAVLMVDMAHIAGLVAAGLHESPIPYAHITTTTTHKTLRGPRGGMILSDETRGKSLNSQIFPCIQGGPLMHVIAAKAVAFGEALRPGFKTYSQQIVKNAAVLAQCLTDRCGLPAGVRRYGQPPHAGGPDQQGRDRQGCRTCPRCRRHHGQQEHHPLRDPLALRDLRRASGHRCPDHPRHEGRRDAPGGGLHRGSHRKAQRACLPGRHPQPRGGIRPRLSPVHLVTMHDRREEAPPRTGWGSLPLFFRRACRRPRPAGRCC